VTVVPLSPVDDAQACLGDLFLLDLRNYLATRLERRNKSPLLVIVDEFPQLVTESQDPGDTAGNLFETARTAGVGLVLASQAPPGFPMTLSCAAAPSPAAPHSSSATVRPEVIVSYAGSVMRLESSGRATGDELGSARAKTPTSSHHRTSAKLPTAPSGSSRLAQSPASDPFQPSPYVQTAGQRAQKTRSLVTCRPSSRRPGSVAPDQANRIHKRRDRSTRLLELFETSADSVDCQRRGDVQEVRGPIQLDIEQTLNPAQPLSDGVVMDVERSSCRG
jgi:hypothetical protein